MGTKALGVTPKFLYTSDYYFGLACRQQALNIQTTLSLLKLELAPPDLSSSRFRKNNDVANLSYIGIMKTIRITVESEEAARSLIGMVRDLDFVTAIELVEDNKSTGVPRGKFSSENEFLSICGLWRDRELSAEVIREQAWRNMTSHTQD